MLLAVDILDVVPTWRPIEAAWCLAYAAATTFLPGVLLRRSCGLTSGIRIERWALNGLLGVLFTSLVYAVGLVVLGRERAEHVGLLQAIVVAVAALTAAFISFRRCRRTYRPSMTRYEVGAAVLIGLLACYYLARTVPLFDYDTDRLRLHGAAYSDKMTNMMPAASLRYDVPPDCLRFAGRKFPSHYFPHLFAASLDRTLGVRYFDAFWFHLPPLGIAINVLALVAFGRRTLKSYAAGYVAAALYGLLQVTAVMKPLDLTPALACAALAACDRYAASGRRRWAAAAAMFVGVMPCYEAFHAAVLWAGLILWGAWGVGRDLLRRRAVRVERIVLPVAATVACFCALQGLYFGERPVAPSQFVVNNTFGDSYRRDWLDRAAENDAVGRTLTTVYAWNRNRPAGDDDGAARPAWYQRVVGRVSYGIGLVVYVVCRFGLWSAFGAAHLLSRRRRGWRTSEGIVGATVLVGFGLPWIIDAVVSVDGRTWSSPNLYRLTEFAAWLLTLYGTATLCGLVVAGGMRPRRLLGAAIAIAAIVSSLPQHKPTTTYFEVPHAQLTALAFLRERVPYSETVVHPWIDCSIREARDGTEAFVYKRHFTLVSNLAGRRCYFEGREDYLFWNGFIHPDEIERRRHLRRAFYEQPMPDDVWAVLEEGNVGWIVADETHPPPSGISDAWSLAFRVGGVRIYRRP